MIVLDGKSLAEKTYREIRVENNGESKTLVIITIGDDEASKVYVNTKKKKAKDCGFGSMHIQMGGYIYFNDIKELIESLNKMNHVKGIIVQKPLPEALQRFDSAIDLLIDPSKDVDGFHPQSEYTSCTPKGIITLLDDYEVPYHGKNVVIAGRSKIVAQPLAKLLLDSNCTVTMIHSRTDLDTVKSLIKNCDIFVSAIGKAEHWTEDYFKDSTKKVALVDVGINRNENGLVGDVSKECYKYFDYYTPVPGGVGAMTVASLMENVHLNQN